MTIDMVVLWFGALVGGLGTSVFLESVLGGFGLLVGVVLGTVNGIFVSCSLLDFYRNLKKEAKKK